MGLVGTLFDRQCACVYRSGRGEYVDINVVRTVTGGKMDTRACKILGSASPHNRSVFPKRAEQINCHFALTFFGREHQYCARNRTTEGTLILFLSFIYQGARLGEGTLGGGRANHLMSWQQAEVWWY